MTKTHQMTVAIVLWGGKAPKMTTPMTVEADFLLPSAGDHFKYVLEDGANVTLECIRRDIDHGIDVTAVVLHTVSVKDDMLETSEQLALEFQEVIDRLKNSSVQAAWDCVNLLASRYWLQRRK